MRHKMPQIHMARKPLSHDHLLWVTSTVTNGHVAHMRMLFEQWCYINLGAQSTVFAFQCAVALQDPTCQSLVYTEPTQFQFYCEPGKQHIYIFWNYSELLIPYLNNKHDPKTGRNIPRSQNKFLKKTDTHIPKIYGCLSRGKSLTCHDTEIHSSSLHPNHAKVKKNRQEQTIPQLLKRETSRLLRSSDLNPVFQRKTLHFHRPGWSGVQPNKHSHTHTYAEPLFFPQTAGKRWSFDVARPDQESAKQEVNSTEVRVHTHRAPQTCPERQICSCTLKDRFLCV